MEAKIHVVRHAEAVHNVEKDFSRLDPELTLLGRQQAEILGRTFPFSDTVGLIITSPLRRTIQTTLLAFTNVLNKRYYNEGSGHGVEGGAELLIDPDLQERSALPCDTGSDRLALEIAFPSLDFSTLHSAWPSKQGLYSADDNAVNDRARKVRGHLREIIVALKDGERRDIVVVTHGVFMKHLVGDPGIDLPKAGWKSYTIEEGEEGGGVFVLAEA
jgi:broad specificity phosphatase PhoE